MPKKLLLVLFLLSISLFSLFKIVRADETVIWDGTSSLVPVTGEGVLLSPTYINGDQSYLDSSRLYRFAFETVAFPDYGDSIIVSLYNGDSVVASNNSDLVTDWGTWDLHAINANKIGIAGNCPDGCSLTRVTISDEGPYEEPPSAVNISNLTVSITDTTANISWNTDVDATGQVDYGTSDQYGSTATDSNLSTSHSISLTGLNASTVYHFRVSSTDASNNTAQLTDNTFTTALAGTTTVSTVTLTATTETSSKDSIAPTLSLSTNLSKAYVTAPTLSGSASDNSGVSGVDYSINGGGSWIAASVKGKGGKQVTFSFSFGVLDDGNYNFLVRAKDTGGNVSDSKKGTLIIDRLPPQVGTVIFSSGPQVSAPTKEGVLVTVAGLEQKITLSAVGGPISLEVTARDKKLNLAKNDESGLWSGLIKFDTPGMYDLTTKSIDGAKNETIQALAKVAVLPAGKVSYLGKVVSGAEISVYVFEPTQGVYILWDGASYGQQNPQKTNENGNYSFLLPTGKYYIEAKISSFIKLRTQIFELSTMSPINADLSRGSVSIPFIPSEIKIVPTNGLPTDLVSAEDLVGKDFPFDKVKEATGVELVKEKQIVSFVASWLPDTSEQVKILESLPDDVKVTVISPQESLPTIEIFKKRGRYSLNFFADPDGKLVEPLLLRFLPVHFFLDENGKIKEVLYGLSSLEQLEISN